MQFYQENQGTYKIIQIRDQILVHENNGIETYTGFDEKGRKIVVKIALSDQVEYDLLEELDFTKQLTHPSIISGTKLVQVPYKSPESQMQILKTAIRMPFKGYSIQDYLKIVNKFDEATSMYIVRQVVQAVIYLQQKKIVHCDLKPANILIQDGKVCIIDFGLSYCYQYDKSIRQAGTPLYLAPELVPINETDENDSLNFDHSKIDNYSIGIVLYEMIVGKCPEEFMAVTNTSFFTETNQHFKKAMWYTTFIKNYKKWFEDNNIDINNDTKDVIRILLAQQNGRIDLTTLSNTVWFNKQLDEQSIVKNLKEIQKQIEQKKLEEIQKQIEQKKLKEIQKQPEDKK